MQGGCQQQQQHRGSICSEHFSFRVHLVFGTFVLVQGLVQMFGPYHKWVGCEAGHLPAVQGDLPKPQQLQATWGPVDHYMTWALVPDADTRQLANKCYEQRKSNTSVLRCATLQGVSPDSHVGRVISFFDRARYKLIQFAHEDANIGCRRLSPRSFSTLLSLCFGSDKPFKSVRGARVLPCQGGLRWERGVYSCA